MIDIVFAYLLAILSGYSVHRKRYHYAVVAGIVSLGKFMQVAAL